MFSKALIALATLAGTASASCVHGTSLHRRQEAGGAVEVSNFGYSGERGPLNWAGLDPANVACRNSKVQSPIVLDDSVSRATSAPQITIDPVQEAEFENLGTTLETVVNGTTVFEGATFELKQFHLHTPSEHRINEEYFPLEMHMVHEGADGAIAVIAVPFQLTEDGSTTALLTSVIENIAQVTVPGTATKTGALDFTELIAAITAGPLFQYSGSLTTPPCAEGLTFLVLEKPLALDVKTFNTLKSVIKFNARYSQNTLGQTNLLDVAVALAVRDDGINVAGGGAVAQNPNANINGTDLEILCAAQNNQNQRQGQHEVQITSDVDVQALVRELVNAGQEIRLETVTTSTTHVLPANGQQNNRGNNDRNRQQEQERQRQQQQEQQRQQQKERERVVIVPQTQGQQHGQQQGKVVVVQNGQQTQTKDANGRVVVVQQGTPAGHQNVKIARKRRALNFSTWAKDKRRL